MNNKNFVILFQGRSGSTYLCDLLNNHPDIKCDMETFGIGRRHGRIHRIPKFDSPEKSLEYLNEFYSNNNKLVGFKYKFPHQINVYPEVFEFFKLKANIIKVIFLYRKDILRAAISAQNLLSVMKVTGTHYSKTDIDIPKLDIDIEYTIKFINKRRNHFYKYEKIAEKIFPHIYKVTYEDLLTNRNKTLANIQRFLEVPLKELKSEIRKNTPQNVSSFVNNYSDLIKQIEKREVVYKLL